MAEDNKPKKRKKILIGITVVAVVVAIISVIAYFLTNKQETYISTNSDKVRMETVYCVTSNSKDAFFAPAASLSDTHTIKMVFRDGSFYRASYSYEGSFQNNQSAVNANDTMHADYNKYMASYGINAEKLYPTFVVRDTKESINLYVEYQDFSAAIAKIFFIGADEYSNFHNINPEKVEQIYRNKSFQCELNNEGKKENEKE